MARPVKNTVDYFPHDCNHKKTMFIIENKFGNNGYAAWFKILEMLGTSKNHVIDCRNTGTWEFLQAKTRLPDVEMTQIIDTLARLNAIDEELWEIDRTIWCQNFVDRLLPVYQNRRTDLPSKPVVSTGKKPVSTPKNTQSKVKEVKEVKEVVPLKRPKLSSNPFLARMQKALGFPEMLKTQPIPNPAKEAAFIKKMLDRGFTEQEIFDTWQAKVRKRGEFVSMVYVNNDIGGHDAKNRVQGFQRSYTEPPA